MRNATLTHKTCFLTGATGGLGRSIARTLTDCGCSLYLTARSAQRLNDLRQELEATGAPVHVGAADLADANSVQDVVGDALRKMGRIDILINCAGVFLKRNCFETTAAEFEQALAVNVMAPFLLVKAFAPGMAERKWGRIVNVASSSAYEGFAGTSAYCASKHGLLGFSRAMQKELKSENVRTFCFSPGSIKTDMGLLVTGQDFETFMEPNEIAEYMAFAISFDSALITEEVRLNRMQVS